MDYRNAQRLENGWIDCEIDHPKYGWIPFTCDPHDSGAEFDAAKLWMQMNSDPATLPYVPPSQAEIDADAAAFVRAQRNSILREVVDPIVSNPLRWGALTDDQRTAWAAYRQDLLDIPDQSGFPHNVTWPSKPE